MSITVLHGDCLVEMASLKAEGVTVDSIVTDPPAGISFMGRNWDSDKGGRDKWVAWMRECAEAAFALCKPGAHAVVWSLPRTSHWTGWAWEDAGWVPRDCIYHLTGAGFPKSLSVSKQLDKMAGAEGTFGEPKSAAHAGWIERGRMRAGDGHEGWQRPWMDEEGAVDKAARQYIPATEAAKQWEGWGTSLKPAAEQWWLFRKPLIGTVAANVQQFGVGALNIAACRVPMNGELVRTVQGQSAAQQNGEMYSGRDQRDKAPFESHAKGRWPANVVTDGSEEVLEAFAAFGEVTSSFRTTRKPNQRGGNLGWTSGDSVGFADAGSPARFFQSCPWGEGERRFHYSSKADAADRLSSKHPTVKPVSLMKWLVKLVTPPNGTVLDPFAGSGTTGMACMAEGFNCIMIEQDATYVQDIHARLAHVKGEDTPLFAAEPQGALL